MVLRIMITLRIRIDLKRRMDLQIRLDEGRPLNGQGFILVWFESWMVFFKDGFKDKDNIKDKDRFKDMDGFAVNIGWGMAFKLTGINSMMRMDLRMRTGWQIRC